MSMKLSVFLGFLLLGIASSAPTTNDKTVVNKTFFTDVLKIYEDQHDIVKIYAPANKLNVDIFFITADIKGDEKIDRGIYVKKGGDITKLLNHGRDVTAPIDEDSKAAYFATKDGIYQYNAEEKKAEKYGTVDDDLIAIEMGNASNGMHVLTADKKVYKVTEDGTKKEIVEEVKDAEQIALDFSGNLFYVDSNNKVFMVNGYGAKEITGLPKKFSKITFIRLSFLLESGIPVFIDNEAYSLHANGSLEDKGLKIDVEMTAYTMDANSIEFFGLEKKIYITSPYISIILSNVIERFTEFSNEFKKQI